MDETRGKRTIGKWWKIEWGRAKRENTKNPWADSSLPRGRRLKARLIPTTALSLRRKDIEASTVEACLPEVGEA